MQTNKMFILRKMLLLILSISLVSCINSGKSQNEQIPNNELIKLVSLKKDIRKGKYPKTNAILISQNGKLLYEEYFNGYGKDSLQDVRSTTKSYTAILTGIAIDKGFIKNAQESGLKYLPQYNKSNLQNWSPLKEKILIEDLLTMRSGLACEQFFGDMNLPNCEDIMFEKKDWVKYGLDQKMVFQPKEKWLYTGVAPMIMGAVISEASGKSIDDFSSEYLFKPLGISNYRWSHNRQTKRAFTAGNLKVRPLDMLKIGQLIINKGVWKGERLISEQMVEEITSTKVNLPNNYSFFDVSGNSWEGQKPAGYGYYWYEEEVKIKNRTLQLKFTFGNGGNYIILIPELDNMVIVFTGSNYGKPILNKQPFDIVYKYILPEFI